MSALIVEADTPSFDIAERIDVATPHPLARLEFSNCRIPAANRFGDAGQAFKVAIAMLDIFCTLVAAAALGMARHAPDEALQCATKQRIFGKTLADFQLTQAKLAAMATGWMDVASPRTPGPHRYGRKLRQIG